MRLLVASSACRRVCQASLGGAKYRQHVGLAIMHLNPAAISMPAFHADTVSILILGKISLANMREPAVGQTEQQRDMRSEEHVISILQYLHSCQRLLSRKRGIYLISLKGLHHEAASGQQIH